MNRRHKVRRRENEVREGMRRQDGVRMSESKRCRAETKGKEMREGMRNRNEMRKNEEMIWEKI